MHEYAPLYYQFKDLIPEIDERKFEEIFEKPFYSLEEPTYIRNLECTCELVFDKAYEVLIHNSLIIGTAKRHFNKTAYLLAFDMNTNRLIWGIPFLKKIIDLQISPYGIQILKEDEQFVTFIDTLTGEISRRIELPVKAELFDLYVTPSRFIYYMTRFKGERYLFGGKIVENKWLTVFQTKAPSGLFSPFGEHLGYLNPPYMKIHSIFFQNGECLKFNCNEILFKDDKLHLLTKKEHNVESKEKENDIAKFELEILKLKPGPLFEVIDECNREIKIENLSLVGICNNESWIFEIKDKASSFSNYLFLDPKTDHQYKIGPLPRYTKVFFDFKNSEIWTWDEWDKTLKKHSISSSKVLGKIVISESAKFLQVDNKGRLLYIDR